MFALYEYLESIYTELEDIKAIYRVSSIVQMEEMLSDLRNNPAVCLMVRDSGDGHLNFKDRRLNTAYHTFYIFAKAKVNDTASRMAAKRLAMFLGVNLIDRMRADSNDFGEPTYGMNDARVDYSELGPIGQNYYGYSFSFTVEQGFVKYVPPIETP